MKSLIDLTAELIASMFQEDCRVDSPPQIAGRKGRAVQDHA